MVVFYILYSLMTIHISIFGGNFIIICIILHIFEILITFECMDVQLVSNKSSFRPGGMKSLCKATADTKI